MKGQESLFLGVVMRRQPSRHAWQDHSWRPVSLIPGAPPTGKWRLLREDGGSVDYLAATLPLHLFPGETSGYLQNLAQQAPTVYVVLRPPSDGDAGPADCPLRPFHVTVCPVEAQDYLDGDDRVDVVAMPESIAAWVRDYARRHHVERPFEKRRRRDKGEGGSGETGPERDSHG